MCVCQIMVNQYDDVCCNFESNNMLELDIYIDLLDIEKAAFLAHLRRRFTR